MLCRKLYSLLFPRSSFLAPRSFYSRTSSGPPIIELPKNEYQDPELLCYAELALHHYNAKTKQNLKFVEILKAFTRKREHRNYFLAIKAIDQEKGSTQLIRSQVQHRMNKPTTQLVFYEFVRISDYNTECLPEHLKQ